VHPFAGSLGAGRLFISIRLYRLRWAIMDRWPMVAVNREKLRKIEAADPSRHPVAFVTRIK